MIWCTSHRTACRLAQAASLGGGPFCAMRAGARNRAERENHAGACARRDDSGTRISFTVEHYFFHAFIALCTAWVQSRLSSLLIKIEELMILGIITASLVPRWRQSRTRCQFDVNLMLVAAPCTRMCFDVVCAHTSTCTSVFICEKPKHFHYDYVLLFCYKLYGTVMCCGRYSFIYLFIWCTGVTHMRHVEQLFSDKKRPDKRLLIALLFR